MITFLVVLTVFSFALLLYVATGTSRLKDLYHRSSLKLRSLDDATCRRAEDLHLLKKGQKELAADFERLAQSNEILVEGIFQTHEERDSRITESLWYVLRACGYTDEQVQVWALRYLLAREKGGDPPEAPEPENPDDSAFKIALKFEDDIPLETREEMLAELKRLLKAVPPGDSAESVGNKEK